MKTATRTLACLVIAAAALVSLRCSSQVADVPGGGTSTENPGLVAALDLVFETFKDTANWRVREYVPGGMDRLDSAAIVGGPTYNYPGGALAKRWYESSDTTVDSLLIVTYTWYFDDTIVKPKTIVEERPEIIDSVLVETRTEYDTATVVNDGDTTTVVQQVFVTDSIHVRDTIMLEETVIRSDTIFIKDTIVTYDTLSVDSVAPYDADFPAPSPDAYDMVSGTEVVSTSPYDVYISNSPPDGPSYVFVVGSGPTADTQHVAPIRQDNVTSEFTQSMVLISKTTTLADGATVSEAFADVDGDSMLFGDGDQVVRLSHQYTLDETTLFAGVDFDGGADGSFATPDDNNVTKLQYVLSTPLRVLNVTYTCPSDPFAVDSVVLERRETLLEGSLELFTTSYVMTRGTQGIANDDRLEYWHGEAVYNSGSLYRIDIEVALDDPLRRGELPTTASVDIVIHLDGGGVSSLEGAVVDFELKTVQGTYYKDGEAIHIEWEWTDVYIWEI